MRALQFTLAEAEAAADEWGFNCGPAAVAAICGLSIKELRPFLGDFESKRYTNPTLMKSILANVSARVVEFVSLDWRAQASGLMPVPWPRYGLARVQWEGPWTNQGVPMAARYRQTHWVGSSYANRDNVGIWDVNCLNNGTGWVGLKEWSETLVPWLLKECHPRANGNWHLTHTVSIAHPDADGRPS
jgi:hypothetical protein